MAQRSLYYGWIYPILGVLTLVIAFLAEDVGRLGGGYTLRSGRVTIEGYDKGTAYDGRPHLACSDWPEDMHDALYCLTCTPCPLEIQCIVP